MVVCSAFGCRSRSNVHRKNQGITFHRFPLKQPDKCDKWVTNMQRIGGWTPTMHDRLCSKHFESRWFFQTGTKTKLLHQAVPTIFPESPGYLRCIQKVERTTERFSTNSPDVATSEEGEETPQIKQDTESFLPDTLVVSKSQESEEMPRNFRQLQRRLLVEVEKNILKTRKLKALSQRMKRYEKRFTVMKQIIKDLKKEILLISEFS